MIVGNATKTLVNSPIRFRSIQIFLNNLQIHAKVKCDIKIYESEHSQRKIS